MSPSPAELGIDDDLAMLGSFATGPGSLARFAGEAPLNTDDRPVVAYRAPRFTHMPDSRPRDRLIALLRQFRIRPDELLTQPLDPQWESGLVAYWQARDRFIEAGRDVRATPDVQRVLQQVRGPLLSVVRISPDFRPAYEPLLRMATALGPIDPTASRALLREIGDARGTDTESEPQAPSRSRGGP